MRHPFTHASHTNSPVAVITLLRDHLLSREAATIQAVACTYDDAAFEQKWGLAFYCKDVLTCGLQKSKEEAG